MIHGRIGSCAGSPLKRSGSGPIFGETARCSRESLAENLDLAPSFHFFNALLGSCGGDRFLSVSFPAPLTVDLRFCTPPAPNP